MFSYNRFILVNFCFHVKKRGERNSFQAFAICISIEFFFTGFSVLCGSHLYFDLIFLGRLVGLLWIWPTTGGCCLVCHCSHQGDGGGEKKYHYIYMVKMDVDDNINYSGEK